MISVDWYMIPWDAGSANSHHNSDIAECSQQSRRQRVNTSTQKYTRCRHNPRQTIPGSRTKEMMLSTPRQPRLYESGVYPAFYGEWKYLERKNGSLRKNISPRPWHVVTKGSNTSIQHECICIDVEAPKTKLACCLVKFDKDADECVGDPALTWHEVFNPVVRDSVWIISGE